jgi:FKBP-type peptidyl-prolyl cis-trans isomerase
MNRTMVLLLTGLLVFLAACANKEPEFSETVPAETLQEEPPGPPIQVNDLKVGTGDPAEEGDTLLVHYTGWLYVDGARSTQFDTTHVPNRPLFEVTIGKTDVLKGFAQSLVGMKLGGLRQVIIPPGLAYGKAGVPPTIPPSSTLEFEIELRGIHKKVQDTNPATAVPNVEGERRQ